MRSSMDVEQVSMAVAYAAFYLIIVALLTTWLVQLALRPRTRMEWAEFGKITAFLAIVLRTGWTLKTGQILSPHVAVVFWVACFVLVLFYLWVILDDWGPPFVRAIADCCVRQRRWIVSAVVLLVVAAAVYAVF